jgi:hypothetical protein
MPILSLASQTLYPHSSMSAACISSAAAISVPPQPST